MIFASAITIAAEDGQTTGTFLKKINKESSAGANIAPNEVISVDTGASARTTAAEDGQTLGTFLNEINK